MSSRTLPFTVWTAEVLPPIHARVVLLLRLQLQQHLTSRYLAQPSLLSFLCTVVPSSWGRTLAMPSPFSKVLALISVRPTARRWD
jgi:hypothetical protein